MGAPFETAVEVDKVVVEVGCPIKDTRGGWGSDKTGPWSSTWGTQFETGMRNNRSGVAGARQGRPIENARGEVFRRKHPKPKSEGSIVSRVWIAGGQRVLVGSQGHTAVATYRVGSCE